MPAPSFRRELWPLRNSGGRWQLEVLRNMRACRPIEQHRRGTTPHSAKVVLLLLASCARAQLASDASDTSPISTEAPERSSRAEAELIWHPGDSEPQVREIVRNEAPWPMGAKSGPAFYLTVIRNRCSEPVSFVVGPESTVVGQNSPSNTLAPGDAITAYLTDEEWVHLRTTTSQGLPRARASGGWIVMTGSTRCQSIVGIER